MMIDRKELLDFMEIGNIRSESVDVQKELLIAKLSEVEKYLKSNSSIDTYKLDRKTLSSRQLKTLQNFFNCLLDNTYLDAFWELWDFVDDYENQEPITINEYNTIYFIVSYFLDQLHMEDEPINNENYEIIIKELKKIMHIMELYYNDVSKDYDYNKFEKCVKLLENKENIEYVNNYLSRSNFFNSRWAFDNSMLLYTYGSDNLYNLEKLCENKFKDINI